MGRQVLGGHASSEKRKDILDGRQSFQFFQTKRNDNA